MTLTLDPSRVSEGAGATSVEVTATLDGSTRTEDAVVTVSVGGGTAAGEDYAAVSSFDVTIAATEGSGTGTFTLTPVDDTVAEGSETLEVSGTTTGLTVNAAELTLTDNDAAATSVTLTVDPSRVAEGAGSTSVEVTATLDGSARTEATVVTVSVEDGTAVGEDYAAVSSFDVTIAATEGSGTGTFTLTPVDDPVAEGSETLEVSGTTTVGLTVNAAELTLTDNDAAASSVTLTVDPSAVSEDAGPTSVEATATLDGSTRPEDTVVTVSVSGGTADAGDYAAVSSFDVTITAMEMSGTGTFTLTPVDDPVAEGPETLEVSGTTTVGLTVNVAELTLTDNDAAASSVTLTVDPSAVSEDAGPTSVEATATLDGSTRPEDTVVTVSVSGGTADAGDYAAVSSFDVTITAMEMSGTGTFTLTPVDDPVAEGPETLEVSGTTTVGLTVNVAELTLTDNDAAASSVTLTVDPSAVSEDAGPTSVEATATLDGSTRPEDTVVTVSVSGGTADAGDYAAVSSFDVTITAMEMSGTGTFTLTPVDDPVAEGPETLEVSGTTTDGLTVTSAELTLTDNDTAAGVTLTLNPAAVSEDAGETEVTVTARLDGAAQPAVTVLTVSVEAETAEADDFAAVAPFELEIPASAQTGKATFTLTPVDDAEAEGPETVSVTGVAGVPGLTVTPAALTITDDDAAAPGVRLSVDPKEVVEDAGPATIRVRATLADGAQPDATTVTVTVDDDEDDYGLSRTVFDIVIAAGATSAGESFVLTPVADTEDEPDQRIAVTGTTDVGLSVTGARVTLKDDDEPNRPPKFDQKRYEFDLPENRSGRETPVVLGRVSARDSDGDRIRYALFNGDRERFTASRGSGTVSYIGEGEDFEAGSPQFELQVTAKDSQYTAKAWVVVRVADTPEPPEAADDRAETPEDTPQVIDVLANDTDPDGDRLRVASVGTPEHGTAAVAGSRVRYTPELNWYGEDRFTYTVADPGGLTAQATVRVTVTPVNDPPEAVDDEAETLEDVAAHGHGRRDGRRARSRGAPAADRGRGNGAAGRSRGRAAGAVRGAEHAARRRGGPDRGGPGGGRRRAGDGRPGAHRGAGADAGRAYGERLRGTRVQRDGDRRRRGLRAGAQRVVAAAVGRAGRRRRLAVAGPRAVVCVGGRAQRRRGGRARRLRDAAAGRAAADAVRRLRAHARRTARAGGREPGPARAVQRRPGDPGADRVPGRTLRPARRGRPPHQPVRDRQLRRAAAPHVHPGRRPLRGGGRRRRAGRAGAAAPGRRRRGAAAGAGRGRSAGRRCLGGGRTGHFRRLSTFPGASFATTSLRCSTPCPSWCRRFAKPRTYRPWCAACTPPCPDGPSRGSCCWSTTTRATAARPSWRSSGGACRYASRPAAARRGTCRSRCCSACASRVSTGWW